MSDIYDIYKYDIFKQLPFKYNYASSYIPRYTKYIYLQIMFP